MIIPGERVLLRPIRPDDYPTIVAWSNDPQVNEYIEGDYPRTLEACPARYEDGRANRYSQRYAIVTHDDERLIGDIELDHIAWRSGDAELRIRIGAKEYWDQGYGTDAVMALVRHAFGRMNLSRIYLRVFSENQRAIRCYEKCGFRKEGRITRRGPDGTPTRVYLMRLLREEVDAGKRRNARPKPSRSA